jgi:hypothetical protein
MKNKVTIIFFCIFSFCSFQVNAQLKYYVPTHYQGIFYMQPSSARATGMGLTTITLNGIENAFYNPATIGPTKEKLEVHMNYAYGSQVYKGGQFPFIGVSYRVTDKLAIGASTLHWIDQKNSPWTTVIGSYKESQERRSQSLYNLVAAYEIIPGLQAGLSGNFLVDRSVDDAVTNRLFILSIGAIYDLKVNLIKKETVQNQKIRFAASFINLLMKNRIEQRYEEHLHYRDVPIQLILGTSYQLSLPLKESTLENKQFFKGAPRIVELAIHIQFKEVLKGPEKTVVNINYQNNTSIGIGIEAWWMQFLALRMGYYFENRPTGPDPNGGHWVTDNKRGFTWGFGSKIPWNRISNGNVPLNIEINFVVSRLLNEYANNVTLASYFEENNLLFAVGLNIKWAKK